ncbi:PREDICTED: uncharacterized protein LOC109181507 [Ipomoea nil]|uniref:uncharacterized protein LOC109181507 n=1 Tax=Ipomoea nil TaxID=35883 RepID=UPI00090159E8|nr:PREDICTED: uncharacterized protein LOC109181507 [Ipomoea nil]
MDNSLSAGCMAVFAVSGSVVLLALKVHKHLMSDFMRKIEFEFGLVKGQGKKKVRFANGVEKPPSESNSAAGDHHHYHHHHKKYVVVSPVVGRRRTRGVDDERFESMPENWQALYKGIIQSRGLNGYM